ncbi:MAG: hypothetical protein A3B38_02650 [Candidatus Levybacteria bacterium RIFCSPLOWO2_01_FULL_36_13]|nr:MAG: hypothetical protein A2684_03845 [Candidatus Levybacteria bacterium RIFCSPHIGHO2_01_FULL_36_15b]OGH35177.1 MAG: hypothetical protein A3B38_02650 [Candidatus Levybacteria bacterium RIFCSPLOWO2_01_FULL_36_13]
MATNFESGLHDNPELAKVIAPKDVIDFIAPKYKTVTDFSGSLGEPDENGKISVTLKRTIEVEKVGVFRMTKEAKEETLMVEKSNLIKIAGSIADRMNEISYCGELWKNQRITDEYQRLHKVNTALIKLMSINIVE